MQKKHKTGAPTLQIS